MLDASAHRPLGPSRRTDVVEAVQEASAIIRNHTAKRQKRPRRIGKEPAVLLKLDLGCGATKREGFLGVDLHQTDAVDVLCDLRGVPWPWPDSSVGEVVSSHFLEHLDGPERIMFMDELWRVMAVDAQATIIVPYYNSIRASQDPTHKWPPVSEASFLYFNRQWRSDNGLAHYLGHCNFDFAYSYVTDNAWASRNQETRDFALRHYTNVVLDLSVLLTKRA